MFPDQFQQFRNLAVVLSLECVDMKFKAVFRDRLIQSNDFFRNDIHRGRLLLFFRDCFDENRRDFRNMAVFVFFRRIVFIFVNQRLAFLISPGIRHALN